MTVSAIEPQVNEIIAQLAKVSVDEIDVTKTLAVYGIDSIAQLEFRELLERRFQIYLDDRTFSNLDSIHDLITYIEARRLALNHSPNGIYRGEVKLPAVTMNVEPARARLSSSGVLYDEVEIGMSLTCLNNLAESPLLKYLGDLRWRHLSSLSAVPSKLFADDQGRRLYPSFFYVEMAFPKDYPMAAYGENDRLKIVSTLKRFGGSMLDGFSYLLPPSYQETNQAPFDGIAPAISAGVPSVRLSNIFVEQVEGSEWIRTARPANPGFKNISELAVAPESYVTMKEAEKGNYLSLPGDYYVPMTDGPVRSEYRLVVDRDFSSTGLVYFANYPIFLDICEREVLASARLPLPEEIINRRTLVRRKSAYLNNASSRDTLIVEVEPWIEDPVTAAHPTPEMAPIRLFINYRMYRKSDERLMMISTAEKLIFGVPFEALSFHSELLARKL